jgi:hypothetical protein
MFAVLILTTVFGWRGSSGAQTLPPKSSGCTPNGNRFNLEALKDAVSQFGEYVAVLPNRRGHGADLVYGVTRDERYFLPPTTFAGTVIDAYYVQRDSSDCAADFESGFPCCSHWYR